MGRFEYLEFDRKNPFLSGDDSPEETPELLLDTAWDLYWKGSFESALRTYSRVLRHQYLNPTAWSGQVWCLIEMNELYEADVWADRGSNELGETPGILAGKASLLSRQGFTREAMLWVDKAVSCSHKREDRFAMMAWLSRAELLIKTGGKGNAELCISQAAAVPGSGFRAHLAIGRSCLCLRKFLLAVKYLDEAAQKCPSNCNIWLNLCLAYRGMGHIRQAEQALERVLELEPSSREAQQLQRELAVTTGGFGGFLKRLFG
ncbi:MAG: tetratricopeptide repeat protein [Candidatus Coatesbacteria bacterium]|nr:tetratricopeptide repeat protein [Candidatus Coatesbacteria bacterium]